MIALLAKTIKPNMTYNQGVYKVKEGICDPFLLFSNFIIFITFGNYLSIYQDCNMMKEKGKY